MLARCSLSGLARAHRCKPVSIAAATSRTTAARNFCASPRESLRIMVITGSTRVQGPPFPARVGERVGRFVERELSERGHTVQLVDPLVLDLSFLQRPQFAYRPGDAPDVLDQLASDIKDADAYVAVTPEYNHTASPALLNILNHFGSSLFSWKPSGIVAYSQGAWGGARAALSLRPILSELGCLPVSAMVQLPAAHEVLDADGAIQGGSEEEKRWKSYFGRMAGQLEWWGGACKAHKGAVDPFSLSPAFNKAPNQRNAPPRSS